MSDLSARLETLRQHAEVDHFVRIALLDDAQFTNGDVEAACHVSATQLHNWVSRGWLKLSSANPGRGKRRLYSGADAIAVAVAAALQPFGMMQVADQLTRWPMVANRARFLLTSPTQPDYVLAITPSPDGDDWLYTPLGVDAEVALPCPGFVSLMVDRLIIETLEGLVRLMEGQEVEPRHFPKKPTREESEDEFLAFNGAAYRDDEGRRIYRGLTVDESADLDRLKNERLAAMAEGHRNYGRARLSELEHRNEIARHEWLASRFEGGDA